MADLGTILPFIKGVAEFVGLDNTILPKHAFIRLCEAFASNSHRISILEVFVYDILENGDDFGTYPDNPWCFIRPVKVSKISATCMKSLSAAAHSSDCSTPTIGGYVIAVRRNICRASQ